MKNKKWTDKEFIKFIDLYNRGYEVETIKVSMKQSLASVTHKYNAIRTTEKILEETGYPFKPKYIIPLIRKDDHSLNERYRYPTLRSYTKYLFGDAK